MDKLADWTNTGDPGNKHREPAIIQPTGWANTENQASIKLTGFKNRADPDSKQLTGWTNTGDHVSTQLNRIDKHRSPCKQTI